MAAKKKTGTQRLASNGPKKTSIGNGKYSRRGHRGGGPNGSTPSKNYRKKYRGQGK